jgi:hypothetical protein
MREEKEIGILLEILKGDPNLKVAPGSFMSDRLIRLAEIHKVVYQLMRFTQQHPDLFSKEQIARLDNHCRQAALRSLTQLHELKRIAAALKENNIGFVVIKGPQLSRMLYGREALKESVDIDIMLVSQPDAEQAHEVLTRLGYTWSNLDYYKTRLKKSIFIKARREVHYISPANGNHIDLHIRPGASTYMTAGLFRNFFDGLERFDIEGIGLPVLPLEKYLVYLCYHGSLHQFCRLAWLLDIRAYLRLKQDALDYPKLFGIARALHTERSIFTAMQLIQSYFGEVVPEKLKVPPSCARRIDLLAKMCRGMIDKDERYGLSMKGRFGRLMYMMVLIKGLAGKVDFVFGIVLRMVAVSQLPRPLGRGTNMKTTIPPHAGL